MEKTIAIVQSNYIPWRGYFDLIRTVDEFVLLDEVQYTRGDWRNRNLVKTRHGLKWLTIPIRTSANMRQPIAAVESAGSHWRRRHWATLYHAYHDSPHFFTYRNWFRELYLGDSETHLSTINYRFLTTICSILEIDTPFRWSEEFPGRGRRSERLIEICKGCGATTYLSGPRGRKYLDSHLFSDMGITLEIFCYPEYPKYTQLFPPYQSSVSILDLIFNVGGEARYYLDASYANVDSA